jgi:regulator of RNase E activity RraA
MTIQNYEFAPMPAQAEPECVVQLGKVETATLGHHLHARFMHASIAKIAGEGRVAGTAVTVSVAGADSTLLYHVMDKVRPGDVLVIDRCGDDKHAAWGGFMAQAARERGLAGVIVGGRVTDPADIADAGVPTWATGVSAITTKLLNLGGTFNMPVSCGGVVVTPGDLVLADECGVVVIPPHMAPSLIALCLADQELEQEDLVRLRNGESIAALTGAAELIATRQAEYEQKNG